MNINININILFVWVKYFFFFFVVVVVVAVVVARGWKIYVQEQGRMESKMNLLSMNGKYVQDLECLVSEESDEESSQETKRRKGKKDC